VSQLEAESLHSSHDALLSDFEHYKQVGKKEERYMNV
jgi:hypothetical protein